MSDTETGLHEGRRVADFLLPAEDGGAFRLYERLAEGPLILVFYRGDW